MADVVITLNELEDVFWKVTMLILGFNIEDKTTHSKVRMSWPTSGAPSWEIDEDICFISVSQKDDLINRQRHIKNVESPEGIKQIIEYTKCINCSFVLYGPNSYDTAELIQHSLFIEEFKEILNSNGLFLIPDIPAPVRVPELFNGQWWERSDFEVNFNLFVRRHLLINNIEHVDMSIVNGKEDI